MKKILIIGNTGFVGKELERKCLEKDFKVIGVSSSVVDITDNKKLMEFFIDKIEDENVDVCVNCSGSRGNQNIDVDTIGTQLLSHQCKKLKIPIIHISENIFISEDKRMFKANNIPNHPNKKHKIVAENNILKYFNNKIIRTDNLYSSSPNSPLKFDDMIFADDKLYITHEKTLQITYLPHFINFVIEVIEGKHDSKVIFHYTDLIVTSITKIAKFIKEYTKNENIIIVDDIELIDDNYAFLYNIENSSYTYHTGLKKYIEECKKNRMKTIKNNSIVVEPTVGIFKTYFDADKILEEIGFEFDD